MNWQHNFHRFQLDDHAIIHDKVQPVTTIENEVFVPDGHDGLADHREPSNRQLVDHAWSIGALQKPWPNTPMDLDRALDNQGGGVIQTILRVIHDLRSSASRGPKRDTPLSKDRQTASQILLSGPP